MAIVAGAGLVVIGLLVWLFGFALQNEDASPESNAVPVEPQEQAEPAPSRSGSEAVFAPVPGFTFAPAPESEMADLRGMSGVSIPGVDLDQLLVGVEGRTVLEDADVVGVALAWEFSESSPPS